MSRYPAYRPRRLRRSEALRRLVRETRVTVEQLVQPLFVVPGRSVEQPIDSMPGIAQLSVDRTAEECRAARRRSASPPCCSSAFPSSKDAAGSGAVRSERRRAARGARDQAARCPDLLVITDVCLCEYTDHGHCGVHRRDGEVDNDATLPSCWPRRRWHMRGPAPTSSRPRT